MVVLFALRKGSPKRGAEQDAGLDCSGCTPGHPQQGRSSHYSGVTLASSRPWPVICSLALLPGPSWRMSERVAWGAMESSQTCGELV